MNTINCSHCGSPTKAFREKRKKYCSKRCSSAAKQKRLQLQKPNSLRIRTCKLCNKEYQPKKWNQKYCSIDCREIEVNRELKEKKAAQKQKVCCSICTGFFTPIHGKHRYCSTTCRGVAVRRQEQIKADLKKAERKRRKRNEENWKSQTCSAACKEERRTKTNKKAANLDKIERMLAREALEALNERLERKKQVLDQITGETSYSAEIEAFLAKGGKVKKYATVWSADVLNSMPEEIF